jgi:hypothetical protein
VTEGFQYQQTYPQVKKKFWSVFWLPPRQVEANSAGMLFCDVIQDQKQINLEGDTVTRNWEPMQCTYGTAGDSKLAVRDGSLHSAYSRVQTAALNPVPSI